MNNIQASVQAGSDRSIIEVEANLSGSGIPSNLVGNFDTEENMGLLSEEKNETVLPTVLTKVGKGPNAAWGFVSCAMYSFCSVAMVLANKAISTSVSIDDRKRLPQISIILFQCVVAAAFVEIARLLRIVEYPPLNWKTARSWLPVNVLFIGMLLTGFLSLVYVSVPMVTIFKNLTNLVTVTGDWYFFEEK